jgi:hypothetical protein
VDEDDVDVRENVLGGVNNLRCDVRSGNVNQKMSAIMSRGYCGPRHCRHVMPDIMICESCRGADLSTNTPHAGSSSHRNSRRNSRRKLFTPKFTPKFTPQFTPQSTPKFTPKFTPQSTPQSTPKFTRRDRDTMPPKKDKKERKKGHRWSV